MRPVLKCVVSCVEKYALGIGLMAVLALAAVPAAALPVEARVGSGPDLASVVVEFGDGAEFLFEIEFDDAVPTAGIDLLTTLEAELADFSVIIVSSSFGDFVDGITYGSSSDEGFGGGENFWHYWVRESDQEPFGFSSVGASARLVLDGGWDGWVYGSAGPPLPEPGTGMLLALALVAGVRAARRRPQSSLA